MQTEAGDVQRVEVIERNLRERLTSLPDEGQTEAEREVVRKARALVK